MKEVGGQFIIATLPVGKEGWESSGNERFAKKAAALGAAIYDAGNAMSQSQWLETLKDLKSNTWAWVLERNKSASTQTRRGTVGKRVRPVCRRQAQEAGHLAFGASVYAR